MFKSFLNWAGGKYRLFDQIKNYMPATIETYIEPFVGGGGMLFQVLEHYPMIKDAFINDLNGDLINCYVTVRDYPCELIESLANIEKEYIKSEQEARRKEFYYEMRKRYNEGTTDSTIESAALFIFLNKSGYNGLYRVNSKGKFNVPCGCHFRKIYNEERIYSCSEALQKVTIHNEDFRPFMNTLFYIIDDATLVYLDPPYMDTFVGYTADGFSDIFQSELKCCCDLINEKNGMFLLSNSDSEFIKEIYKDYYINYVQTRYVINSNTSRRKNTVNEVLIFNKKSGLNSFFE